MLLKTKYYSNFFFSVIENKNHLERKLIPKIFISLEKYIRYH